MNYYDVSFESGEVFCANIVKAAKESDIKAHYEAKGYKCISIAPVSEERAMASVKYHPGKPIVEIPEIKEEFELGEEFYYTPDLMGEELTFAQLFDMIGERVFLMTDPDGNKPIERQKSTVVEMKRIIGDKSNIEEAVLEYDSGIKDLLLTVELSDFSEEDFGNARTRAWKIKKKEEKKLPVPKKRAVVSTVPNEADDKAMSMSTEEYEILAAEKANQAVDNGLKWTAIGILFLAVGIKLMRDGKLYKNFNFRNFEEYCKSKGLSREQGRKYASIGDMLERRLKQEAGNENAKLLGILPEIEQRLNQSAENGKLLPILQKSGVEVGYLLSRLEDSELDEVVKSVNLEETNGADVKKTIKEVEARHKKELENLKRESEKALEAEKAKTETLKRDKENAYSELSRTEQRLIESKAREERLRREHTESIADYESQIQELIAQKEQIEAENSELSDKLKEEREQSGETIIETTYTDKADEIQALENEVEHLKAELEEARKKTEISVKTVEMPNKKAEYKTCLQMARDIFRLLNRSMESVGDWGLYSAEDKKAVSEMADRLLEMTAKATK